MHHESRHTRGRSPRLGGSSGQCGDGIPPVPALTDGILCGVGCYHLLRTHDGDPQCRAFDEEPLHPSFDADPEHGVPRAERCSYCIVAEDLFGKSGVNQ